MKISLLQDKLPEGFVDIHNKAFKGFFLTSLGFSFLNLYYRSLIKSPKGIIICLFDDRNNLLGFAAGTIHSKGFHKEILLSNIFSFARILVSIIIHNPKAIFRLFKNLDKNKNPNIDNGEYAELLSIAVPPGYKGLGYGKLLLKEFEAVLQLNKIKKTTLTTDYVENDGVIAFYEKMGYNVMYEFIAYPDRSMYKMTKDLF